MAKKKQEAGDVAGTISPPEATAERIERQAIAEDQEKTQVEVSGVVTRAAAPPPGTKQITVQVSETAVFCVVNERQRRALRVALGMMMDRYEKIEKDAGEKLLNFKMQADAHAEIQFLQELKRLFDEPSSPKADDGQLTIDDQLAGVSLAPGLTGVPTAAETLPPETMHGRLLAAGFRVLPDLIEAWTEEERENVAIYLELFESGATPPAPPSVIGPYMIPMPEPAAAE